MVRIVIADDHNHINEFEKVTEEKHLFEEMLDSGIAIQFNVTIGRQVSNYRNKEKLALDNKSQKLTNSGNKAGD